MATEIQINRIKRMLGEKFIELGIAQTRDAVSDIPSIEKGQTHLSNALASFGMAIHFLDEDYYTTSFENWQKIIEVMNPIAQTFKWTKEKFDCDNRAMLMSSLIPVMYGLTMCSPCYCDVHTTAGVHIGYHYNNLIIDDAGNVYLWDLDNNCIVQKITNNTPVMGNWKYNLSGIRPF